jgi:cell division protein FtsL
MDHCPLHEKQAVEIDTMSNVMAEIANNVLWLTRIGKWALGIAGAAILLAMSVATSFNDRLYDVTRSVQASEYRITNLIEAQERDRK